MQHLETDINSRTALSGMTIAGIFPHMAMALLPDSVTYLRWIPTGPATHDAHFAVLVPAEARGKPGFDAYVDASRQQLETITNEDLVALRGVQRGLATDPGPSGGRFSPGARSVAVPALSRRPPRGTHARAVTDRVAARAPHGRAMRAATSAGRPHYRASRWPSESDDVMSTNTFIFSTSEEHFPAARRELTDEFGQRAVIERLGPDVGALSVPGTSLDELAKVCRTRPIAFVKHLTDDLDPRLLADPGVTHARTTAGNFFGANKTRFDVIVNDMKMDPRLTCDTMLTAAGRLRPGGKAVVTLKLAHGNVAASVRKCLDLLRRKHEILHARQLHHNRHEITVVAKLRSSASTHTRTCPETPSAYRSRAGLVEGFLIG
ncbi:SRPBCC family protein [Streptomyces sp. P1-3]|uniref:SRPBCC family protein n=1 Tax=Streptomyces sp. P1-3 TaxID=3421658 RepID=UPI003D36A99C